MAGDGPPEGTDPSEMLFTRASVAGPFPKSGVPWADLDLTQSSPLGAWVWYRGRFPLTQTGAYNLPASVSRVIVS